MYTILGELATIGKSVSLKSDFRFWRCSRTFPTIPDTIPDLPCSRLFPIIPGQTRFWRCSRTIPDFGDTPDFSDAHGIFRIGIFTRSGENARFPMFCGVSLPRSTGIYKSTSQCYNMSFLTCREHQLFFTF